MDCVEERREGVECLEEGSASVEGDGAEYGMEGMDCMKEGRREGVSGVCGGEEGGL